MAIAFVTEIPTPDGTGLVPPNGALPATSAAFTPAAAGDLLIFFAKYSEASLSLTDSNEVTYTALALDQPEWSDICALLINPSAEADSQTVTVSSTGGGNIWEPYLYEFSGVGSVSNVSIAAVTSDPTTADFAGTPVVVPEGSWLIARGSSSGAGFSCTVAGGGTQLATDGPKGTLAMWAGAGESITPQFVGQVTSQNYTVIQAVLSPNAATVTAVLAAIESADVGAGQLAAVISARAAAVESSDVGAVTGATVVGARLAGIERPDTAQISASSFATIMAVMAAVERPDLAQILAQAGILQRIVAGTITAQPAITGTVSLS